MNETVQSTAEIAGTGRTADAGDTVTDENGTSETTGVPGVVVTGTDLPGGVVHELPADLAASLLADPPTAELWRGLTPLGRNEFVCWVEDAKKPETRARRIRRTGEEMHEGKRRPCCWPGCKHRERTGH